ncbi:DUF4352 domain-containing protein [Flavobacterium maritimum]|uniref:DUF4352 domain-containing protein n=1 Tax=Flavobacterium maritimum TaxID=3149042 RepID=UPI0032B4C2BE
MKKIIIIAFLAFSLNSCITTYEVIPQNYDYSENINFVIDKVEEGKSIATGNGSWNASRGSKFVFIYVTLKNSVDQKQKLDFDNFYLLNPKDRTKHKVEWAMLTGLINLWGKVDSSIQKGDTKKRKLVFLFPKEEKANFLMVNEKVIEIDYKI